MWLYFLLTTYILGSGLILVQNKTNFSKMMFLILTFGLMTFLAMFRSSGVGNDTQNYLELFNAVNMSNNLNEFMPRFEVGYLMLNKFLTNFSSNPQIIIIVSSLVTFSLFARFFYRYSESVWLSTFLFFTLGYFGTSMNVIRLNLAIAIILIAYDFLRERKFKSFIVSVIIASLFHRTAIIFVASWWLVNMRLNKKNILLISGVTLFIFLFSSYFLAIIFRVFPVYSYYIGSSYLDGEVRIASVISFMIGIVILLFGYFSKYIKKDKKDELSNINKTINDSHNYAVLLLIGVCILIISFNFNLLDRAGEYFTVFSLIYLPNSLENIRSKSLRLMFKYFLVLLFFAYSTIVLILRPEWNVIYPYSFFTQ